MTRYFALLLIGLGLFSAACGSTNTSSTNSSTGKTSDPCSILSKEAISNVLGETLAGQHRDVNNMDSCIFQPKSGNNDDQLIVVIREIDKNHFLAYLVTQYAHQVSNVSQGVYWAPSYSQAWGYNGHYMVIIGQVGNVTRDQQIKLAEIAVQRLPN